MSRFYGTMNGQAQNSVTRRGSPSSGLSADINGWNLGITVYAHDNNGMDEFEVWTTTGGSNNQYKRRMIGTLTKDGFLFSPPPS